MGMEKVAQEAGLSRRTLYLHFESKVALFIATVQHIDETLGTPAIVRQAHEAQTALENLDEWVNAYGQIEPYIYSIAKVIYTARQSDQAAEASWQDRMAFRRGHVWEIIKRLKQEGIVDAEWTEDEGAHFMWAHLSVHTYEYLVVEAGWTIDPFVSHVQMVLRSAIVKKP